MSEFNTTGGNSDTTADSGNPISDRLASMAHGTIDEVAAKANHAEHEIRDAAARTAEAAKHARDQVADTTNARVQTLRGYIEKNPLLTVGIAFAAGVLLNSIIRR
jgi:ElaB/YqjD/DUF883 family membrane-anchored ribosome-binding protein